MNPSLLLPRPVAITMLAAASLLLSQTSEAQVFVNPYTADANTALLLQLDGSAPATTLTDATGHFTGGRSLTSTSPSVSPFEGVSGPNGLGGAATIKSDGQLARVGSLTATEVGYFNTQNFSIETWVRFDSNAIGSVFQIRDFGPLGPQSQVRLWIEDRTDVDSPKHRFGFAFSDAATAATRNNFVQVSNAIGFGTWYHLAVTYDSNTAAANDSILRIYLTPFGDPTVSEAVLLREFTSVQDAAALSATNTTMYMGGEATNGKFLNGDMAMFRYQNEVLGAGDFNLTVIPEPGSVALLGLGLGALLMRRRRLRA